MNPEQSLAKLNHELPVAPAPSGLYRPCITVGNLALVSGHAPILPDGLRLAGCVGRDSGLAEGRDAARQAGLAILATLREYLGSLNKIKQVVRVFGMVNCVPDFTQHPAVIDGCSQLFADVFGQENGVGVRCASGAASLPGGVLVEIEASFLIDLDGSIES